jgi:hypothetical protein
MRVDPLDIFSHTIVSLPARLVFAWALGTAGAFVPILIGNGFGAFEVIRWQFLFFPIYLFVLPLLSGWWGVLGLPLLVAFAWRIIVFLREESDVVDLGWIFILPFLIGIRATGERWPIAAIVAAAIVFGLVRFHAFRARSDAT